MAAVANAETAGNADRETPSPASSGHTDSSAWSKETWIAALSVLGILIHLITRYGFHVSPHAYNAPLYLTLGIGGTPLGFGSPQESSQG